MPTATLKRPLVDAILREDFARGNVAYRVDKTAGIIYDVKVVGKESGNSHGIHGVKGTRYTEPAFRKALHFYENLNVNKNHPDRSKPHSDRLVAERIGWLVGPYMKDGEVYAKELHLFVNDPDTAKIIESAEKHPESFCLSHNALGKGEIRNGMYEVVEIPEVRSADIVTDGGTTRSLFESEKRMATKTFRQLIESCTSPAKPKLLAALLELGEMGDMPMSEPAGEDKDWKQHLVDAIGKLVVSEDTADHDMAKKIMAMLKPAGVTAETPAEVPEGEEDDDKDKKEKDKEAMESLQREVADLKREKAVRDLCESENFQATPIQRRALLNLTEADRKDFIKELRDNVKPKTGPRSVGAHQISESRKTNAGDGYPKDGESLIAALRVR